MQLNYLSGEAYNSQLSENDKIIFAPIGEITIKEILNIKYPFNLNIKSHENKLYQSAEPYLKKAVLRGYTAKTDDAYKIKYNVKLKLSGCLKSKTIYQKKRSFAVPVDPYTFYWAVPSKDFILKNWINYSEDIVNPCSTDELADYPNPDYYWYFWKRDFKNLSIDCDVYLRENSFLNYMSFESFKDILIQKRRVNTFEKYILNKDIVKIGIIYGFVNHKEKAKDFSLFLNELTAGMNGNGLIKKYQDIETYLRFYENVNSILKVSKSSFKKNKNYILHSIAGHSRLSNKKFEIEVYIGATDVFEEQGASHWDFYLDSLKLNDATLYWGHSGLGENLSLENAFKFTKRKLILTNSELDRPRLISLYSCYSYNYFGEDLKRLFDYRKLKLVYTGNAPVNGGALLGGTIDYIDRIESTKPKVLNSTYFDRSDFLIIEDYL